MSDHDTGNDPIDELSRFGAGFSNPTGGDMPRSPADIRRRGDQIRRRRTALVAGASALAVAAVAVPIFAIVGGNPRADAPDNVADDATGELAATNLLTNDDTVYADLTDWSMTETSTGEGSEPFNLCAREKLTALDAEAVLGRDFELVHTGPDAEAITPDPQRDALNQFRETIAEFPDAVTASAAYETISQWLGNCAEHLSGTATPDYEKKQTYPVDTGLGDDSIAQIIDSHYGPVPKAVDEFGDEAFIAETGLVRVGNRIAVLASVIVGLDYNFDTTPVAQMIPAAATRLQPGAKSTETAESSEAETGSTGAPNPDPGGSSSDSAVNPAIADDFPLAAGWPEADGGESTLKGPTRTLSPYVFDDCGGTLDVPQPVDRLKAEWMQPEDFRARQLSTYATPEEASAALNVIADAYRNCPEHDSSPEGYVSHHVVIDGVLGGESQILGTYSTFDGNDAIGIEVIYLIRLGTALLVINGSNEGSAPNPEADFRTKGAAIAAEATDVIAGMCAFTEAGC